MEAVLTSTHNICFEQKYEKYQNFLSENFHFLVVKISVYLNRHVFVMIKNTCQKPPVPYFYLQFFTTLQVMFGRCIIKQSCFATFLYLFEIN